MMQQEAMIQLNVQPIPMTDDQFFELCAVNHDLRLERTSTGKLLVMTPSGTETGGKNFFLVAQVWLWNEQTGLGKGFESSAGFTLPNGAIRAPDVAWVRRERWEQLPRKQREKFAPICPDFVIELRSPSDSLRMLRAKMQEYLDNGTILGWLIDPQRKVVEIFRKGHEVELLERPEQVSGDPEMPGLLVHMEEIWE